MKKVQRKQGFSIIETLVAIAIITIGLTAPIQIAQRSTQAADVVVDRAIANYLAQEGIEYIRATRDGNAIAGDPWLQYMDDCDVGDPCDITDSGEVADAVGDLRDCPAAGCLVNFDGDLYGAAGVATPFTRAIEIDVIGANEAEIRVRVTWTTRGINNTIQVRERILNWGGG